MVYDLAQTDAFQGYIARKYGRRFREFIGGRLEVKGVRKVKNWFEVETTAFLRGEAPFAVTFHVSNRVGRAGEHKPALQSPMYPVRRLLYEKNIVLSYIDQYFLWAVVRAIRQNAIRSTRQFISWS